MAKKAIASTVVLLSFMKITKISCLLLPLFFLTEAACGAADVESRASSRQHFGSPEESASLDILKKMEFLQQEVQELRGKCEEQTYQLQQLQEHQKKLYLDLDRRLREGGPAKVSGVSSVSLQDRESQTNSNMQGALDARLSTQFAAQTPAAAPLTGLPTTEQAAAEEKAYQNAYHLIQNKDYDAALNAFKSLVSGFPQGKYVPNAHYWLGEIYLVKGNLDLAATAFDIVCRQYPQHPKAADSLLKLGYVEYSKGQWKKSQAYLNQVKTLYPGSTSAQLADSRLDQMRQEGHE